MKMNKWIDKKLEQFKPLLLPLVSILGEDDFTLVIQSLDTLRVLSMHEVLRDYTVDNGAVSVLCSYIA